MKIQEGPAFGALIIGMGLAFLMNAKGFPLWQSIGAGVVIGLVDYFILSLFKSRSKKDDPKS